MLGTCQLLQDWASYENRPGAGPHWEKTGKDKGRAEPKPDYEGGKKGQKSERKGHREKQSQRVSKSKVRKIRLAPARTQETVAQGSRTPLWVPRAENLNS